MSESYRIVMVQVDAVKEETVRLADIMGHIPTREVTDVLNSQWAREKGWQTKVKDRQYCLEIPAKVGTKVGMEFHIEENDDVRLKRFAESSVTPGKAQTEKIALAHLLEGIEEQYNLAFNEVLGRAIAKFLLNRARDLGYEIVDQQMHEQDHIIDMELKMNVYEMA